MGHRILHSFFSGGSKSKAKPSDGAASGETKFT